MQKEKSKRDEHVVVDVHQLLVGDELGHVYIYAIEWPSEAHCDIFDWQGNFTIVARVTAHTQQICGLSWSPDAHFFASGGNDNVCFLFVAKKVIDTARRSKEAHIGAAESSHRVSSAGTTQFTVDLHNSFAHHLPSALARHKFQLAAAVKAIAFCPWSRGLLALGGGSNDRCIHFYHTLSGACLATIDCAAQVTSLIWSTTRREIAATFGFAQPEHPYRIAVFAWPSCECVVKIPWADDHRALCAISYPGGPHGLNEEVSYDNDDDIPTGSGSNLTSDRVRPLAPQSKHTVSQGGVWWSRTRSEGCLVVCTSDASIKFHEIWAEEEKSFGLQKSGLLGGSHILDSLHGIDQEGGDVIR